MQWEADGHHFVDFGSNSCPSVSCQNCDLDYLEYDSQFHSQAPLGRCPNEPPPQPPSPTMFDRMRCGLASYWTQFRTAMHSSYVRIRFGNLEEVVKAVDGGVASEIEYRGRGGQLVGYWAYGSFDPAFPYRG